MKSRVSSRAMMTMTSPRNTSTETRRGAWAARCDAFVPRLVTAAELVAVTIAGIHKSEFGQCSTAQGGHCRVCQDLGRTESRPRTREMRHNSNGKAWAKRKVRRRSAAMPTSLFPVTNAVPVEAAEAPISTPLWLLGPLSITARLCFSWEPRVTKMLELRMGTDLPLREIAVRARRMYPGSWSCPEAPASNTFPVTVTPWGTTMCPRTMRGSSRMAWKESPDREVALERDESRWTVIGVPAGTAVGMREPVGKIPPLSDVLSNGKC